jgi:hypothetical protein
MRCYNDEEKAAKILKEEGFKIVKEADICKL